ncbi:MAG: hypothetical protein K9N06_00640 [Candidatus Cloacimonetes bacterium]|nr:hypothetical protein [Candidatus Cloacimonadota bacterium]
MDLVHNIMERKSSAGKYGTGVFSARAIIEIKKTALSVMRYAVFYFSGKISQADKKTEGELLCKLMKV